MKALTLRTRILPSGLECVVDASADLKRNPLAGCAIAIDGVYASGKGTLANTLARLYRLKFLDTGTLYRAVAWKVLQAGGDPADEDLAVKMARELDYDFRHKGNNIFGVWIDGREVTEQIRGPEVSTGASVVGVFPEVRAALSEFMKDYAREWQPLVGVLMDGRDIAGKILPEAQVKLYLNGDVEIRARRRWVDYGAQGREKPLEAVIAELKDRDARDEPNLKMSRQAPGQTVIDTSHIDAAEVLRLAEEVIAARLGNVPRAMVGE